MKVRKVLRTLRNIFQTNDINHLKLEIIFRTVKQQIICEFLDLISKFEHFTDI